MTAATDAQLAVYKAAKADAYMAMASACRKLARANLLNPEIDLRGFANSCEVEASDWERMAAELTGETA